jgi:hypothetical protein
MSTNDPYQTNDDAFLPATEARMRSGVDPMSWGQERYAPQPQPTNGLAVAALVLGIVWAFWIGSALAIVFGHVALGQIRQRNQSGKGMAVAGLVLGYVGAGTFALFVVLPLLLGAGA